MGLFYNDKVSGAGVAKKGPQKRPFFRFWEIFANKFWTFFKINLIYVLFCLPIVTFGPATAAMTALMRNICLERPQFVFHEFWKQFKKNFKQSFVIGLIDVIFLCTAVFCHRFFSIYVDSNDYYWFFYALTMAAEIIFLLINFYIYPQIVALDLRMSAIVKNSVILAFVNLKGNLITLAFYILYAILMLFFKYIVLALMPLLPLAWLAFLTVFNCYPAIQKFIINPFYEANGEHNPELPEDDDEDVVFEDRGGSEAPINLKKSDKTGRVIK
ncbi:MAG: YesL family protein [Oscillospiraceae bacterium]|nr:YesL family protein [Oscillospiraceae bacterium]